MSRLSHYTTLADPKSSDSVVRESTRLWCAGVGNPQTTLDPNQMKEWIPNATCGGHAVVNRNGQDSQSC